MELNARKGNGKKGMDGAIMAIFLMLFFLIFITAMSVFMLRDNTIEREVEIKSNIHTMGNALDAAKLYMDTSLEYSIYQACYDNLKRGGWDSLQGKTVSDGYAVWDTIVHPDDDEFKAGLENSTRAYLKLYQGRNSYVFLSDYYVDLPEYQDVLISLYDTDPKWMFVAAFANNNLKTEKTQESGEYIVLQKESTLQNADEYRIDCYGIYLEGKKIPAQAVAAVNKAWADVKAPTTVTGADSAEVEQKLKGYKDSFVSNADTGIGSIASTDPDYKVTTTILSSDLKWTKKSESVNDQGATTEIEKYTPEVYVKFDVTNVKDGQQFPVFDGQNVVMSPMTLTFVAKYVGTA